MITGCGRSNESFVSFKQPLAIQETHPQEEVSSTKETEPGPELMAKMERDMERVHVGALKNKWLEVLFSSYESARLPLVLCEVERKTIHEQILELLTRVRSLDFEGKESLFDEMEICVEEGQYSVARLLLEGVSSSEDVLRLSSLLFEQRRLVDLEDRLRKSKLLEERRQCIRGLLSLHMKRFKEIKGSIGMLKLIGDVCFSYEGALSVEIQKIKRELERLPELCRAQRVENVFREVIGAVGQEHLAKGQGIALVDKGLVIREKKERFIYLFGPVVGKGKDGTIVRAMHRQDGQLCALKEQVECTGRVQEIWLQTRNKVGQQVSLSFCQVMPLFLSGDRVQDGKNKAKERALFSDEEMRQQEPIWINECLSLVNHYLRLRENGIFHTDIKPENCLICDEGTLLIDFDDAYDPNKGGKRLVLTPHYTDVSDLYEFYEVEKGSVREEIVLERLAVFQMGTVFYALLGLEKLPYPLLLPRKRGLMVDSQGSRKVRQSLEKRLGDRHPLIPTLVAMLSSHAHGPGRPSMQRVLEVFQVRSFDFS